GGALDDPLCQFAGVAVGGAPGDAIGEPLDIPDACQAGHVLDESLVVRVQLEAQVGQDGADVGDRHDVSPLRAPGAAAGRVVSAVSVTTCFHYRLLDGDCKGVESLFSRPRSIFPEAEQLG